MTFVHRFDNKFWTKRNLLAWSQSFRKLTSLAWIWTPILNFFDINQVSYCCLNMFYLATRNSYSTYAPIEWRKTESLTFCWQTQFWNIFSIARDQSLQDQILVKYMLVSSYSQDLINLKVCWKVTFVHYFGNKFWIKRNLQMRSESFRK